MNFGFQLTDEGSIYTRHSTGISIFDFIGHIGGVAIFFILCANILLGNYATNSLYLELSESLFRTSKLKTSQI